MKKKQRTRKRWDKIQSDDFAWFVLNYDAIYSQYGECYVGIRKKKIFGTYSSFREADNEASKMYHVGTYIIQRCNGDESGYTSYIASTEFRE